MTQEPEALRLASELEVHAVYGLTNWSGKGKDAKDAAAELRRLSALENEWAALSQDDGKAEREIERLRAENQRMASELRRLARWEEIFSEWDSPDEVHEALVDQAKDMSALKPINAQLLDALEEWAEWTDHPPPKTVAAIAAARSQT